MRLKLSLVDLGLIVLMFGVLTALMLPKKRHSPAVRILRDGGTPDMRLSRMTTRLLMVAAAVVAMSAAASD